MLQKIRDGSSGPLAYIVVGVIALVFGVWGIGSYFTPPSDPVVISAAGTDITQSQFRQAFNQRYQRLRQMMGDHFDPSEFPRSEIRKQVAQSLVNQAVMTNHAKSIGYHVTDADLLAQIRQNPEFQENGKFSVERYKSILSRVGMAPSQYEARLRKSLLGSAMQRLVAVSAFTVAPEVDALYRQAHEQRKIAVLQFDPSDYDKQVKVDDKQISQYYNQHHDEFMSSPKVKLAYVVLDASELSPAKLDRETLEGLYSTHKSELATPEKRSADMIRIAISKGDDAKARKAVQDLLAQAKKGDSLKQIAAKTSGVEYKQIKDQTQSSLPDAVANALFGLKKGQLSSPVRGGDAWYLIRMTGKTASVTPGFDDPTVQKRLKAMAHQQEIASLFRKKAEKLDSLAYQAPNSLKTISDHMGLKIQHSDWIRKTGDSSSGIGHYDAVRKAAFTDAVLKDKLNSKVLDLGGQKRAVVRVADYRKSTLEPLKQVSDTIRKRLVAQQALQEARKAAQQALTKARSGKSITELAAANPKTKLEQPGFVGRTSDKLDPKILQTAFGLPGVKHSDQPQYGLVTTSTGTEALVQVSASRVQKDDSGQTSVTHEMIARQLRRYNASSEYAALDQYLRQQAKVKIHKNLLED